MQKQFFSFARTAIPALVLLFTFNSCAINPVTGKRELNLLSESQEIALGVQSDPAIVAQYGLYNDEKLAKFIDEMGQRMAKVSHRPDLQYHFRVLDSPVINAFALPGGFVYFTRGILAYMNSEAELAGVLGHEIGHITARHGAKAYTRAQLAQVGLAAGYIFSETFRQFGDIAAQSIGLLFLKFGRDQERQSDELGVEYSTHIGYDATNMSHFFGTLNRLREESGQSLPDWQSTHPNPEQREATTLRLAKEEQAKAAQKGFETNRDSYLALIDGIVFGEDPRQGFVENDMFYHPELEFQFPVPTGWLLQNTPMMVQMVNKEQNAGIQFTLAQETSARAAADKFAADSKGKVVTAANTRTNGFNTEVRQIDLTTEQGTLSVLSYFIEKDKYVYIFHGFTASAQFRSNLSAFRYTMDGFDLLRNRQAKNAQPSRIQVVTVNRTTTLEQLLKSYPNDKVQPDELAVINGMELSDTLRRGDKVKVVRK